MGNEEPLDPTEPLGLLGSKDDMLIVVVPSTISSVKAGDNKDIEYFSKHV
jgi:hypothetical protein